MTRRQPSPFAIAGSLHAAFHIADLRIQPFNCLVDPVKTGKMRAQNRSDSSYWVLFRCIGI